MHSCGARQIFVRTIKAQVDRDTRSNKGHVNNFVSFAFVFRSIYRGLRLQAELHQQRYRTLAQESK